MRTLLLTAAIVVAFAAFAATEMRSGVWTAELEDDGLSITLFQGRHHQGGNMMSLTIKLAQLDGVTTEAVTRSSTDVKFALVRAAGVFSFDGHFASGKGAGHFTFTPDPTFLRDMEQLGFSGFRDDELVLYAAQDLTAASLRELKSMGYQIRQKDLDEIAVFHITPALVREYASLGYPDLKLDELVELRVGNVDAGYIKEMRSLGFDRVSAKELAELGIQNVTPKYVLEMRAAIPNVGPSQLEELKIANITPARIETYRKAGYANLTAEQLSEFGLQNVTPEYIESLRKAGYDNLTPEQLVNMRIFNVTPEYIKQMQDIGVRDLHKMIELKETGASEVLLRKR